MPKIPEALMAAIMAEHDFDDETPRPVHEAQIMEITARFADYQRTLDPQSFPFVAGQLVTPRQGSTLRQQGDPHIVLEIRPDAAPCFTADVDASSKPTYGARQNMRVMSLSGKFFISHGGSRLFSLFPTSRPHENPLLST